MTIGDEVNRSNNFYPQTPLTLGVKRSKFTFLEQYYVAYQIKGNHECSNMVAYILPTDPTPPLWVGVKRSNSTFSEHGHVANQIKGNHECSNIVANILPADTPHPGDGVNSSNVNFFRTWSCSGLEIFFWTYSSCGASGLNFSLVLTPVGLVLKSVILKETKHIIQ